MKNVPNLDDITGIWYNNRIITPKDKYYIDKAKAQSYKKMEVVNNSKEESK